MVVSLLASGPLDRRRGLILHRRRDCCRLRSWCRIRRDDPQGADDVHRPGSRL